MLNLNNYLEFLDYFQGLLNNDFADQAPYIKCKQGCAKCCQNGDYPFSEMELHYLKQGFLKLDKETQNKILDKIQELLKKHPQPTKETFMHECPFLIDNSCSVYQNRGLICRTFGLIYYKEDSKAQVPFCAFEGLNYSDVIDVEKNMITPEKVEEFGANVEPKSFNVYYHFITEERISNIYNFSYGKKAPLLDLLREDEFFNKHKKDNV